MKKMFEPITLAGVELGNRFIRSATRDGYADESGYVTGELVDIYERLAKSGLGAIITGHAYVTDKEQSRQPGQMGIYSDACIDGCRKLTDAVHRHGVKIFLQVSCIGAQTFSNVAGKLIWGPSAVADLATGIMPVEMSVSDIQTLQQAFTDAAVRAKEAGFDGIQLHAAHGYVLNKFLTPYYNRRTDIYGGSLENRARMLLETLGAVRSKVGEDYPVFIKLNCEDFMDGGVEFPDSRRLCNMLVEAGISGIEVSGGSLSSPDNTGPIRINIDKKPPYFLEYGVQLAAELPVPVILVGGNRDFAAMEKTLNSTEITAFSLCRPLIHEPELISRWRDGDRTPAKCISCNKCLGLDRTVCTLKQKKNPL